MKNVSIIIPAYNEEKYLPEIFDNLKKLDPSPMEIIGVDGASKDNTASIIMQSGHRIVKTVGRGRALQMNEGAYQANGDILVFLHADTTVPCDLVKIVNDILEDHKTVLGGFVSIMKGKKEVRWFFSAHNFLKTYLGAFLYNPYRFAWFGFRFLFGDQVMFCRKADFLKVDGFNTDLPIMEDADLCIKLNRLGKIKQIHRTVKSSDRRVAKLGSFKAYFRYLAIAVLWAFGASPYWLKSHYDDIR